MVRYLVVALLTFGAVRSFAGELSRDRPKGTPDFHAWALPDDLPSESTVDLGLANVVISYRLYTNPPPRNGIYGFAQYRICNRGAAVCDPETLIWIRWIPERKRFLNQVFYRYRARTWKKLWLGRSGRWYQIPVDSREFKGEMTRARQLYSLSEYLRNDDANPASLTF